LVPEQFAEIRTKEKKEGVKKPYDGASCHRYGIGCRKKKQTKQNELVRNCKSLFLRRKEGRKGVKQGSGGSKKKKSGRIVLSYLTLTLILRKNSRGEKKKKKLASGLVRSLTEKRKNEKGVNEGIGRHRLREAERSQEKDWRKRKKKVTERVEIRGNKKKEKGKPGGPYRSKEA